MRCLTVMSIFLASVLMTGAAFAQEITPDEDVVPVPGG